MATRFVPDADLERNLRGEAQMIKARLAVAEAIVAGAERVAPEGTGRYRRSLRAAVDGEDVRAESIDLAAHLVEFGSINNPAYSPLRIAADRVGRYDEAPKP